MGLEEPLRLKVKESVLKLVLEKQYEVIIDKLKVDLKAAEKAKAEQEKTEKNSQWNQKKQLKTLKKQEQQKRTINTSKTQKSETHINMNKYIDHTTNNKTHMNTQTHKHNCTTAQVETKGETTTEPSNYIDDIRRYNN